MKKTFQLLVGAVSILLVTVLSSTSTMAQPPIVTDHSVKIEGDSVALTVEYSSPSVLNRFKYWINEGLIGGDSLEALQLFETQEPVLSANYTYRFSFTGLKKNKNYVITVISEAFGWYSQPEPFFFDTYEVTGVSGLKSKSFFVQNLVTNAMLIYNPEKETAYTLTNMMGQVVKSGTLIEQENSIDVTDIQKGYYVLQVNGISKKILKT